MRLTFLGGTGTVTGSKYLLEHDGRRLLVDCGLFQGLKQLRLRNWEGFPVPPASIDAVVLTHAHLDHSGFLPRLAELGFRGRVHCSAATRELCGLMLLDSARLLEEEADYANRHGYSKHHPALPLYTEHDARQALECFTARPFDEGFEPIPGVRVLLRTAGHLLGAASVRVEWERRSLLFSGDLGRSHDLLMRPPAVPEAADWVVVESTYGDRTHPADGVPSHEVLAAAICRAVRREGSVLIPAFAVDRTELVLHALSQLAARGDIPAVPVYVDSPMALEALDVCRSPSVRQDPRSDLPARLVDLPALHTAHSAQASMRLNEPCTPSIILSASGMATGGRVRHRLRHLLPASRHT